jgi:hypothetical protein
MMNDNVIGFTHVEIGGTYPLACGLDGVWFFPEGSGVGFSLGAVYFIGGAVWAFGAAG